MKRYLKRCALVTVALGGIIYAQHRPARAFQWTIASVLSCPGWKYFHINANDPTAFAQEMYFYGYMEAVFAENISENAKRNVDGPTVTREDVVNAVTDYCATAPNNAASFTHNITFALANRFYPEKNKGTH